MFEKRTSVGSYSSGGHGYWSYERSIHFHSVIAQVVKIERWFKPTVYRVRCTSGWNNPSKHPRIKEFEGTGSRGAFVMQYVEDACEKFLDFETEDSAYAWEYASLHLSITHPFTCWNPNLTPAWMSGSVLPRRKDIHHDNAASDEGNSR